jgi:hypothetical protein
LQIQYLGLHTDQLEVSIFDLNGKLLLKDELRYFKQHIDVSILRSGTYILHINQGKQLIHQEKLIKR